MSRENSRQPSPQPPAAAPAEAEPAAVKQPTVGDIVKRVEEKASVPSTPVHMIHPPMSFEDSTQVERLRVEIRDLTEKLDTLRIKRKEDQQRIKELEIESQKVQSLMQVRTKLADENKDLMRQLEEARMELDGLREWKNIHHEQLASSSQQLEMYLIDKETAEEKADMLRRDISSSLGEWLALSKNPLLNELLKEQMEELTTNLEILQEEMATAGSGGAAPVGNSVQMKGILSLHHPAVTPKVLLEIVEKIPPAAALTLMRTGRLGRDAVYASKHKLKLDDVLEKIREYYEKYYWLPRTAYGVAEYNALLRADDPLEVDPLRGEFTVYNEMYIVLERRRVVTNFLRMIEPYVDCDRLPRGDKYRRLKYPYHFSLLK